MLGMSDSYQQLLEATIRHLEERKARGVKFISVSHQTVAALVSPGVRESTASAVAPCHSPAGPVAAIPMFDSSVAPPPSASAASSAPTSPGAAPLDLQTKQAAMAELQARA